MSPRKGTKGPQRSVSLVRSRGTYEGSSYGREEFDGFGGNSYGREDLLWSSLSTSVVLRSIYTEGMRTMLLVWGRRELWFTGGSSQGEEMMKIVGKGK